MITVPSYRSGDSGAGIHVAGHVLFSVHRVKALSVIQVIQVIQVHLVSAATGHVLHGNSD